MAAELDYVPLPDSLRAGAGQAELSAATAYQLELGLRDCLRRAADRDPVAPVGAAGRH